MNEMVEPLSDFPFRKLRYDKYLTLEVMTYVEHPEVYKFMYSLNDESRTFLEINFISVRNEFINAGLITFHLEHNFNSYLQLEKLYY